MPFIGRTPTPVPLTSSDIPDSIITDAKIVGMTSSKLSGALPAISGASLTGISTDFVKLSSATASNSASISFDLNVSTYDNFLILGHKMRPATDATEFYMYFSEDSGSSYLSTTMYSGRDYVKLTGGQSTGAEQNDLSGGVQLGTDLGNDKDGSCQIWLYGMANAHTGANKFCNATLTAGHESTDYTWNTGFICIGYNAINNVKIAMSSGNLSTGVYTLYGFVK